MNREQIEELEKLANRGQVTVYIEEVVNPYDGHTESEIVDVDSKVRALIKEALSLRAELARSRDLVKEARLRIATAMEYLPPGSIAHKNASDWLDDSNRAAANADSERSEETHGGET